MSEQRSPALEDRFRSIENRLRAIETKLALGINAPTQAVSLPAPTAPDTPQSDVLQQLGTQSGQLLLIFAGAFLFRFVTKSELVAPQIGALLGFAYALFWLWFADTRAAKGQAVTATFCATAATLLVLPMITESLLVFKLITPGVAAFALAAFACAVLWVASRRGLRIVAWIGTLGTMAAAVLLVARTHQTILFGLPMLVMALVTTWMGYAKAWRWLRWPCALLTDLTFFVALRPPRTDVTDLYQPFSPELVQVLGILLPVAFLALFRVIDASGRPTRLFAYIQCLLALVIGLEGALNLAEIGFPTLFVSIAAYAISLWAYHWALIRPDATAARGLASMVAALALIIGSINLTGSGWAVGLLSAASASIIVLAVKTVRLDLKLQATIYVLTAALLGNLPGWFIGVASLPQTQWLWPNFELWAVLLAGIWTYLWSRQQDSELRWEHVVNFILLLICIVALAGLVIAFLVSSWQLLWALSAASFHFLVTLIGSVAASLMGYFGYVRRIRECRWSVWPLYLLLAAKLALVDLRFGTEVTLFGGFAVLGLAIMVSSRQRIAKSAHPQ